MPEFASATLRPPSKGISWPAGLCVAAVLFVLAMIAARRDPVTGFTSLIDFGQPWAARRIPALAREPIAIAPDGGYDGQFYAQIAVAPGITSPSLQQALDNPAYRARRILLPMLAHLLGGGQPWAVLQVYALLNLVAWLALAWIWWREVRFLECAARPSGSPAC